MWLTLAGLVVVVVLGVPLSIWLTAPLRRNKKAFAIASALFLSFGLYNPAQDKIGEAREDEDYGKRQKAGDPPASG